MYYSHLLLLLTVLFWGAAPIFDKAALKKCDPVTGAVIRGLAIGLAMIIIGLFFGKFKGLENVPKKNLLFFAVSGILAGALGTLTYLKLLQSGQTSKIVPLAATYPLVTAILGVMFLGETLTFYRLIGIVLIISGIFMVK